VQTPFRAETILKNLASSLLPGAESGEPDSAHLLGEVEYWKELDFRR